MIPERQREALMRLTMCARDECMMCIYQPKDDRCKDIATTAMHILANALKVEDADTPLTDAEITELAKEIVHKMIDDGDIAEDAYPDLRQRMHEAVERLDEYYPSEDEGESR